MAARRKMVGSPWNPLKVTGQLSGRAFSRCTKGNMTYSGTTEPLPRQVITARGCEGLVIEHCLLGVRYASTAPIPPHPI